MTYRHELRLSTSSAKISVSSLGELICLAPVGCLSFGAPLEPLLLERGNHNGEFRRFH